ncbi:hypothetical protein B0H14DRAFT_2756395, partial [Mycena olivaceomarginata]
MPATATQDQAPAVASSGGAKRTRTTRRVNTAERRARRNAVERQRRETLNGRLLDLATLLSNLNPIRRPSKAAIVNSAITHLNALSRHRILAAQQLRMMKSESDALRREVNQWRARAGAQTFLEPMRSEAFGIVIRGELEFEAGDSGESTKRRASTLRGSMPLSRVRTPVMRLRLQKITRCCSSAIPRCSPPCRCTTTISNNKLLNSPTLWLPRRDTPSIII